MKSRYLSVVFLAASTAAFAFNQPVDLKGITQVHVKVSDLPLDLVKAGVQQDALAAALAEALKSGGLTVLPGDPTDTVPTVTLRVTAARVPDGRIYSTEVVLDCLDNVSSPRTRGPLTAVIWSRDVLSLLGAMDQERVAASEKTLIDLFVSDWLVANQ